MAFRPAHSKRAEGPTRPGGEHQPSPGPGSCGKRTRTAAFAGKERRVTACSVLLSHTCVRLWVCVCVTPAGHISYTPHAFPPRITGKIPTCVNRSTSEVVSICWSAAHHRHTCTHTANDSRFTENQPNAPFKLRDTCSGREHRFPTQSFFLFFAA